MNHIQIHQQHLDLILIYYMTAVSPDILQIYLIGLYFLLSFLRMITLTHEKTATLLSIRSGFFNQLFLG